MDSIPLEQTIRTYVTFEDPPNAKGFFPVLCCVCGDHGKKGKRAGFKFSGNTVGYNCFNCGHHAVFNGDTDPVMSSAMVEVMKAWHIPEVDWNKSVQLDVIARDKSSPSGSSIEYPVQLNLPDYFYPLSDDDNDDMAQIAISYLSSRELDWTQHQYMLVKPTKAATKWVGRLIVPHYFRKRLIFWQGRDLIGVHAKKYMSPFVPRDVVLGGFDNIFKSTQDPLFITEGWFDSQFLDGVAILGSRMTPQQIAWISQSPRQKIVIPDKYGSGHILAEQAVSLGWSVSTPDIGACKDVNDAVCRYGRLYTMQTIHDSTSSGFEAVVNIGLYCENNK